MWTVRSFPSDLYKFGRLGSFLLNLPRSSGAFSLSIWTHNFKEIQFTDSFIPVGASSNASSEDAVELGSGWLWGQVYAAADEVGKVVVGGGEPSVGVGGHIQGGGHGPLTSTYGMAADNVLQATVVTTEGNVLVVNAYQNIDLYWAIRGVSPSCLVQIPPLIFL